MSCFAIILKKVNFFSLLILSCLLLSLSINDAFARAGCCSKHGGVKGCNSRTNHLLCNDGTDSPTCLCTGGTMPKTKTTRPYKKMPESTTTETTTTPSTTKPIIIPKGCCARHGGVSHCDKKSGYFMCRDGSRSPSCRCQ